MNRQKRKALIIGCGIAGPAVGLFLKRAGIEAEIYETRTTSEGYSLSLSSNGVAVLKLLSLDGAAFAEGSAVTKWIVWNGKGKRLGEGVLAGPGEKSLFIKRVPLGAILSDEAERQGIKIERGKRLQNIHLLVCELPASGGAYQRSATDKHGGGTATAPDGFVPR